MDFDLVWPRFVDRLYGCTKPRLLLLYCQPHLQEDHFVSRRFHSFKQFIALFWVFTIDAITERETNIPQSQTEAGARPIFVPFMCVREYPLTMRSQNGSYYNRPINLLQKQSNRETWINPSWSLTSLPHRVSLWFSRFDCPGWIWTVHGPVVLELCLGCVWDVSSNSIYGILG